MGPFSPEQIAPNRGVLKKIGDSFEEVRSSFKNFKTEYTTPVTDLVSLVLPPPWDRIEIGRYYSVIQREWHAFIRLQ